MASPNLLARQRAFHTDLDSARGQKLLVAQAEGEAEVAPNNVIDHLARCPTPRVHDATT